MQEHGAGYDPRLAPKEQGSITAPFRWKCRSGTRSIPYGIEIALHCVNRLFIPGGIFYALGHIIRLVSTTHSSSARVAPDPACTAIP